MYIIRLSWVKAAARRLLPLLLLAASPLPGVGPSDGRRVVDGAAAPWSALARLQVPGVSRCTAVRIAPRAVLTAAHCLWSVRLGHFVRPDMVYVLAGYDMGRFTGHARATSYRLAPGRDVAEVMLDAPLVGPALGFAPEPLPGAAAMLGGYNQDRNEVIEADTGCQVLADNGWLLRHDCAATRGTSGAPLLVRGADGAWRIAGIQSAAVIGARGGVAVPTATLQAWLADKGASE